MWDMTPIWMSSVKYVMCLPYLRWICRLMTHETSLSHLCDVTHMTSHRLMTHETWAVVSVSWVVCRRIYVWHDSSKGIIRLCVVSVSDAVSCVFSPSLPALSLPFSLFLRCSLYVRCSLMCYETIMSPLRRASLNMSDTWCILHYSFICETWPKLCVMRGPSPPRRASLDVSDTWCMFHDSFICETWDFSLTSITSPTPCASLDVSDTWCSLLYSFICETWLPYEWVV